MDIQAYICELSQLINEEKHMFSAIKTIRIRKKEIEDIIKKYISSSDDAGLVYDGIEFSVTNKNTRMRKRESEKVNGLQDVLKNNGIRANETIIKSLLGAVTGEVCQKEKLVVKKQKK